ncbi:MAG: hypothetical protein LBP67_05320 [Bacteroidales bacterium]|jgi:protein-tyrosine phosphatase|nr:hypothetical protein [Bacteroidales bacterium]
MFSLKKQLNKIVFNTDIHCHILPGIDDGFKTFENSLSAIKMMFENGVRNIIFTPHIDSHTFPNSTEDFIINKFNEFIKSTPSDIGINFGLAAEYMVTPNFDKSISDKLLCLNGFSKKKDVKYILIEMSYFFESNNIKDIVFALNLAGFKPVLAHPERYLYYARELKILNDLRDMGVFFQMNMMSLSGTYGRESIIILDYMIKNNFYDFIASDLHSIKQYNNILDIKFPKKYFDFITKLAERTKEEFSIN